MTAPLYRRPPRALRVVDRTDARQDLSDLWLGVVAVALALGLSVWGILAARSCTSLPLVRIEEVRP